MIVARPERGILISGQEATPGSLNAWLRTHDGYVPGTDDFEESAAEAISPGHIRWTNSSMHRTSVQPPSTLLQRVLTRIGAVRSNDLAWSEVVSLVDSHAAVIVNVMHGEHFVLVVGYDKAIGGDTLYGEYPGLPH